MNHKELLLEIESKELLEVLKLRFEENQNRHRNIKWENIQEKLENNIKLWSLNEMEKTGGEPDVISYNEKTKEYLFYDCSIESPRGRRNLCYDREALQARREHKPQNNVIDVATDMGVNILTQEQYQELQKLGNFDTKTSSWIMTPPAIRDLGGALFCDKRYDHVFVYHNGAGSYYASRGFRACLSI